MKKVTRTKRAVDKVRASRDGHEFHEAWTARRAMQLLWPECDLTAIAVENLSPGDQHHASVEASEIADITLYYGAITFEHTSRTTIAQFKYSIADSAIEFRAADAKKTVKKFAKAYQDYAANCGERAVEDKLDFELITNRPVYAPLLQAIEALAKNLPTTGEAAQQAKQFKAASGLDGKRLANFAGKCKFVGRTCNLPHIKNELAGLMVDWSATYDPIARARLGKLRELVRDKAGSAGTKDNLIMRTDILAALEVSDVEDLLPSKPLIADVGRIVVREQLTNVLSIISGLSKPLLIHAPGGVGKTVFMTSLASAMRDQSEVVFFDCFGGGAYRSPEDARHLPKRGLVHVANTLAFRGLCDPILPGSPDVETLFRTFRRRLVQCVDTLNRTTGEGSITLFIDAIDNANLVARERSEEAFPIRLLESISYDPIPGVRLIVSCRPERKPKTYARYQEFELLPFTPTETADYLRSRLKRVSQTEIKVAQARSGGNPRVLEHLVKSGRGLLDESEIDKRVKLDDLIQQRITDALATANERGYAQESIHAFLAGLAVLPPPVPLDEYAGAHGLEPSAVESFAADLSPLLERTSQGLMFRDEPTETLVRDRYSSNEEALRRVAANLLERQDSSVYAARALPGLLHTLDDGDRLFQLAFDDRIPASITSTVGKRNIRYARLKAAVLHAAIKNDHNQLGRLLVELSTIASVDQRGASYIRDYPDLVVAAQDVDATRRLFESRTGWQGTRHARLTIANSLSGQSGEAYRHARMAQEWIDQYYRSADGRGTDSGPEHLDIASIPFFLLCEGRIEDAATAVRCWSDWYAYEICEYVVAFYQLAVTLKSQAPRKFVKFAGALVGIGPLTAALSFQYLSPKARKDLLVKLSRACKRTKKLDLQESLHPWRERPYQLQDGLRKAAAYALSIGLTDEALAISRHALCRRPSLWSLRDQFYYSGDDVFPFVFQIAVVAAATRRTLHEKDVLPQELVPICSRIRKEVAGKEFRAKVRKILTTVGREEHDRIDERPEQGTLSYDQRQLAERFLDQQLQPLLELTQALVAVLSSPWQSADKAFIVVLSAWEDARRNRDPYQTRAFSKLFRLLGLEAALFALQVRSNLKTSSVNHFLTLVHSQDIAPRALVKIVSILAQRKSLHELAGAQAQQACKLIDGEDEVRSRSYLFADLGRAMLSTSLDEASVYFRNGLDQMDAIGSGDYEFTNELLLFASTMKGDELDERDFHTLTNLCELNLSGDPEKFPWGSFASGLSRAAGPRALAKLSRWDDRSRIDVEHTLLPYLTALVADEKMELEVALGLNRLARPVEYWFHGTNEFIEAVRRKGGTARPDFISELLQQYEDNHDSLSSDWTIKSIVSLAEDTFGKSSERAAYLSAAHKQIERRQYADSSHINHEGSPDTRLPKRTNDKRGDNRTAPQAIAASTNPTDQALLIEAVTAANDLDDMHDLEGDSLALRRAKVPFGSRAAYIRRICSLEHLSLYWKLAELKECRDAWMPSSAALGAIFKDQAIALVRLHANDLVSDGRLSRHDLKTISDLTGVRIATMVLELIKEFAHPDSSVPGTVWLAIASFIGAEADEGESQLALTRLLRSDTAQLANNVVDGAWREGIYPESDIPTVAAGFVWRMLGSPYVEGRWRAAHSLRCFAGLGRWDIVDSVVHKLTSEESAGPFQAGELAFYFLHARLWLLIALARMAIDHPDQIARYAVDIFQVAREEKNPHVLMRHFAARALLVCVDVGELELPTDEVSRLRQVDLSPHPHLDERIKKGGFYQDWPRSGKKEAFEFHLDYDFHKHHVDSLGTVFGQSCSEVADILSEVVRQIDPSVSSMHETGGRTSRSRDDYHGMTSRYHTYGQQLGWHALFFTAGRLLRDSPVTNDSWHEDPWGHWLSHYILTRYDGFWLSDGMDRQPLDTMDNLLERAKDGRALTGDCDKLLQLVGITSSRIGKEIVVDGSWRSADDIRVRISSALVSPLKAQRLARRLTREDPMRVWLPKYEEDEEGNEYYGFDSMPEYTPWIVHRSGEAKLDEHDPFGAPCANLRPRVSDECVLAFPLSTDDPFGRRWLDNRKRVAVWAQAWGRESKDSEGLRLICSSPFLKSLLKAHNKDLLLLISLERYERESHRPGSRFTHTIGVVRVASSLDFEYFRGKVNFVHESRF